MARDKREKSGKSLRCGVLRFDRGPKGDRPALARRGVEGDRTQIGELFQRIIDALAADMTMEEPSDLFSSEAVGSGVQGAVNTIGGGVASGRAEDTRGAGKA